MRAGSLPPGAAAPACRAASPPRRRRGLGALSDPVAQRAAAPLAAFLSGRAPSRPRVFRFLSAPLSPGAVSESPHRTGRWPWCAARGRRGGAAGRRRARPGASSGPSAPRPWRKAAGGVGAGLLPPSNSAPGRRPSPTVFPALFDGGQSPARGAAGDARSSSVPGRRSCHAAVRRRPRAGTAARAGKSARARCACHPRGARRTGGCPPIREGGGVPGGRTAHGCRDYVGHPDCERSQSEWPTRRASQRRCSPRWPRP